jgi:hypothetical protein
MQRRVILLSCFPVFLFSAAPATPSVTAGNRWIAANVPGASCSRSAAHRVAPDDCWIAAYARWIAVGDLGNAPEPSATPPAVVETACASLETAGDHLETTADRAETAAVWVEMAGTIWKSPAAEWKSPRTKWK